MSLLEMTVEPQPKSTDLPRPLNPDEREFLVYLLNKFVPNPENYLSQLERVVVVGQCACGCPSIDMWKAGEEPAPGERSHVFWSGSGTNAVGELVGLLLWQTDGMLSGLEIFPCSDERDCGLPCLESIEQSPPPTDYRAGIPDGVC